MRPAIQRKAVKQVRRSFNIRERRACFILGVDRTSVRYAATRTGAVMMATFGRVFARSRLNAAGSDHATAWESVS